MNAPVIIKAIPAQVINERASFGPFDLKPFIQAPAGEPPFYQAELENGEALPKGLICTSDGLFTGIPAKGTEGAYGVVVTASNIDGEVKATFVLTIKASLASTTVLEESILEKTKAQIWAALENNEPLPDLSALSLPITGLDIYYLLERWGTLKIWDAFNLDPPGLPKLLNLKGMTEHYRVYDRGSCLVAVPTDLFSSERTLRDGLMAARAMANEVYQRNWTIELVGFDKLVRAAWLEIQHLGDKYGNMLEVVNYDPSINDVKLYTKQSHESGMNNL